jgi:8-oxo-dGTP pyrophosphatase MutT (NUDIX family)
MIRLFCATVYIFNPEGTHTLLLDHRKLKRWVPPGGKIDPNEIPDDAAIRECKEETGLDITLLGEKTSVPGGLIRPYGVQLNSVIPLEKDHIDLIYLAIPTTMMPLEINKREAAAIKWFSVDEVMDPSLQTFPTVRQWTKRFAEEMSILKALVSPITTQQHQLVQKL